MDQRTLDELAAEFPGVKTKSAFLGAFSSSSQGPEIADPWGRKAEDFRACYERMVDAVGGLLAALLGADHSRQAS